MSFDNSLYGVHKCSRQAKSVFAATHRYGDATAKSRHSPGTPFNA